MAKKKNTVLVTVDSLRYDRCGFSGADTVATPTLEEMAESGVNFETAIAPGSATPDSVPVTMTGEFPPMKTSNAYLDEWVRNQSVARQTIAEQFSERGYTTGAFSANPWASRYFGFDDGFDYFEDFFGDDESETLFSKAISRHSTAFEVGRNINDWLKGQNMFMSWGAFYDDIIEWVEQTARPYFLWLFLVDVHVPYFAGSEFRTQSKLVLLPANVWLFISKLHEVGTPFDDILWEAYDNCIRHTDEFLRQLRNDLSADDPLIAVHGDHGDEFGEFDRYGHGGGLSEPLIRVPFVVDNGPTGSIEEVVSLQSLPEILIELATEDPEISEILDQWSPDIAISWIGQKVAVRAAKWKFVYNISEETADMYRIEPTDGSERLWTDPPHALEGAAKKLAESASQDRIEKKRIVDSVEELIEDGSRL